MPRYIAFLRAINVGNHYVKMEVLRQEFQSLGFSNVETFIASGNVIFESEMGDTTKLEKQVEEALHKALSFEVETFIRTPEEVAAVAENQPFPPGEVKENDFLYVAFLAQEPNAEAVEKILSLRNEIDDFHIRGRELYWLCRVSSSKSTFTGARLERTLKMPATMRNVTTVKKLAEKYG